MDQDAPAPPLPGDSGSVGSDTLRAGSTILLLEPTPGQSHLRREDWVERFAEVLGRRGARNGSSGSPQRGRLAEMVVYSAPLETSVLRTYDLASSVATAASRHHMPPLGAKCFTLILGTGKVVFAAAPSEAARNDWLDRLEQFGDVAVNDDDRESPPEQETESPTTPAALEPVSDASVAIARRAQLGVEAIASGSSRALNPLQPPSSPQDAVRSAAAVGAVGTRKRNASVTRSLSPASESSRPGGQAVDSSPPLSPVHPPSGSDGHPAQPGEASKPLWPPAQSPASAQTAPPSSPPSGLTHTGPQPVAPPPPSTAPASRAPSGDTAPANKHGNTHTAGAAAPQRPVPDTAPLAGHSRDAGGTQEEAPP